MLESTPQQTPDFTDGGDIDAQMPTPLPASANSVAHNVDVESNISDSGNLISVHDVASDNNIANVAAVGNTVGNVVGNTTDSVVGDSVSEVTDTVEHTVDTGAGLAAGAGLEVSDHLGALPLEGGVSELPVVGGPVEGVVNSLPAPSDLPVVGGPVGEPIEDIAGQLPLDDVL